MKKLIAAMFLLSGSVAASAEDLSWSCVMVTGVQSNDVLWIRECPSASCDKVGYLDWDQELIDAGDCRGNWCQIMDDDYDVIGWSSSKYLTTDWECEAWEIWSEW